MDHKHDIKSEICISDLIIALTELPWKSETQAVSIFQALGFDWQNSSQEQMSYNQTKKIYDRNHYRQKPITRSSTIVQAGFSVPPSPELPVELPQNILSSELKPLPSTLPSTTAPIWLNDENVFLTTEPPTVKAARTNLFPTLTNRGLLSSALRVKKQGKEANIPKLIEHVIKGRLPKEMPGLDCITLKRGCQLLLDYSDTMVPYWEDLTALANQVQDLLGGERVKIYEFDQDPISGKHWIASDQATNWQADPTRPVLVASDIGITGQRYQCPVNHLWLDFINQCTQKNIPLIVLVPWQECYWPINFGRHPILIHWNPHTTATMIKKWVGKGHEVK